MSNYDHIFGTLTLGLFVSFCFYCHYDSMGSQNNYFSAVLFQSLWWVWGQINLNLQLDYNFDTFYNTSVQKNNPCLLNLSYASLSCLLCQLGSSNWGYFYQWNVIFYFFSAFFRAGLQPAPGLFQPATKRSAGLLNRAQIELSENVCPISVSLLVTELVWVKNCYKIS